MYLKFTYREHLKIGDFIAWSGKHSSWVDCGIIVGFSPKFPVVKIQGKQFRHPQVVRSPYIFKFSYDDTDTNPVQT